MRRDFGMVSYTRSFLRFGAYTNLKTYNMRNDFHWNIRSNNNNQILRLSTGNIPTPTLEAKRKVTNHHRGAVDE